MLQSAILLRQEVIQMKALFLLLLVTSIGGEECYNQLVLLKAGSYPNEGSIFTTTSDLTGGCCFDLSLLR
jgi:hypothetical protein